MRCGDLLLSSAYAVYERMLKRQLARGPRVEHVAVIQDGNRRYANRHNMPVSNGHRLGAKTTEKISDWCLELGIKHLTVYAFSTENFSRSEPEKRYIFNLIAEKLLELCSSEKIHKNRVRVRAIGRIDMLPEYLQNAIREVEAATEGYSQMYLNVALAYGGQYELVDAARAMARDLRSGTIRIDDVDEDLVSRYLYPIEEPPVPKVDLIIRTGGELRTSNFLPWQANGSECAAYFCAPYWPEFRKIDFLRAIRTAQSYASRSTGL
ncbi:MAG: polyprenyl diphosphate synthase [Methanothrix sp.]|uniref:polyprenyl diphosphate synthase n=1 Tax=Methanothrix sp. TaxID=90426 RepID=UPI00316A79DF|nr:polyprenyl diphosphate synthase [Methanothrix sp.]